MADTGAKSTGKKRTTPRKATPRGAQRAPARGTAAPALPFWRDAKVFISGAFAGCLAGGATVWYATQTTEADPAESSPAIATPGESPRITKPQFNFYTVLPNQDLNLAGDIEGSKVDLGSMPATLYILQAGSFRRAEDADRRKGELALLGLDATIEQAPGQNGLWYRVYLGPFDSKSAMARARSLTAEQAIDTLLMTREVN